MASPTINIHLDDTLTTMFSEFDDMTPMVLAMTLGLENYPYMATIFFRDNAYAKLKEAMSEYERREVNILLKKVLSVAYEKHVGLDDTCVGCGTVRGLTHLNDCAIGEAEKQVGR